MLNPRMGWDGASRGNVFVYNTEKRDRVHEKYTITDRDLSRNVYHIAYLPAYIEIIYE